MNKHTPGPWFVHASHPADVIGPQGFPILVAKGFLEMTHPECYANARLAAMSPAMLSLLEVAADLLDADPHPLAREWRQAYARLRESLKGV